jgi:single-strand DNA-binding protein
MAGLAKAIIIGHLGRDPELRYTPSGKAVATFSVATSRSYTGNDGERQEETEWFRVQAWGRLSEVCNQYLRKGSKIFVEGRLSTNRWTDREGLMRFDVRVTATEIQMLDRKPEGGDEAAPTEHESAEHIPF